MEAALPFCSVKLSMHGLGKYCTTVEDHGGIPGDVRFLAGILYSRSTTTTSNTKIKPHNHYSCCLLACSQLVEQPLAICNDGKQTDTKKENL